METKKHTDKRNEELAEQAEQQVRVPTTSDLGYKGFEIDDDEFRRVFAELVRADERAAPVQEPISGYIKKIEDLIQERDDARSSRDFYKRRADSLQEWQSKMRDPERTIVCDILANGHTLEPAGDRYTPPAAQRHGIKENT